MGTPAEGRGETVNTVAVRADRCPAGDPGENSV